MYGARDWSKTAAWGNDDRPRRSIHRRAARSTPSGGIGTQVSHKGSEVSGIHPCGFGWLLIEVCELQNRRVV